MSNMLPRQHVRVAGIVIDQDQEGRYRLNDLHQAAGGERRHGPSLWLENEQTKALVQELSDTGNPVSVIKGGTSQGTYACRELVYAYAMWISAKFHLEVIRTFDAVATGQVIAVAPARSAISPAKEFRALFGVARLIGLDKNAAAISANQATATLTGINMLQLMERTHLPTPDQEICFTPTELGSRFCKSAKSFNQLLAQAGLQESIAGHWVPTEKGRQHAVVLDTGKAHASGTPIQQVKWRDSVLQEVAL